MLHKMFGADSLYAKALAGHPQPGKKKSKTANPAALLKEVNTALDRTAGRPEFPQPLKPRSKDSGDVYELNFNIYLAEGKKSKRDTTKDVNGLPPAIAEVGFPDDHPIVQAFMNNDRVPKEPRFTTSDDAGRPSGWEILKQASYASPTVGYIIRVFAVTTLGGFTVNWNDDNKLFMLNMYANGDGVKVFALPEAHGATDPQSTPADMDAYASVLGPEVMTKRAYDQVAEATGDDEAPAVKRVTFAAS
jgi:hypothetical protein